MRANAKMWLKGSLLGMVVLLALSGGETLGASSELPLRATVTDEKQWNAYMNGARLSASHGFDRGAEKQFLSALKRARKFGPKDRRLAETLRELAKIYGHQDKLAGASAVYEQWLVKSDKVVARKHGASKICLQNVAMSLQSYAALLQLAGHPKEAADTEARAEQICAKKVKKRADSQPRLAIEEIAPKVRTAGYSDIRSVKFENDRYEMEAKDNKGRPVSLLVNPETGAVQLRRTAIPSQRGSFLSMAHIVSKVEEAGFTKVHFVDRKGGLYEVHAHDDAGRMIAFYVHPKTGELLRHPKTGKPLSKYVPEDMHIEQVLSIEEIVANVIAAGYGQVVTVKHNQTVFVVHAHDAQGKLAVLFVDPTTGKVLPQP